MVLRMLPFLGILPILVFSACNSGNNESQASGNANQEQTDQSNSGLANVKDDESQRNILQVTLASDAHSTLAKAVKAAELQNTLSNPGPFTAFAPTDKAFQKVPEKALKSLMKPENKKKLAGILERHVAPVSYDKDQLKKMAEKNETLFMANGDYVPINAENGNVMFKDAKIVKSIKASNGMIHVVDKVVLPEN